MKPSRQLVIHPATSHVLKSGHNKISQSGKVCGSDALVRLAERSSALPRIAFNQQIQRRRMRKLRRLPKPSMLRIEHPKRGSLNRIEYACRNAAVFPGKRFRLRNRRLHHLRLLDHVSMLLRVSIGNAQQHAPKAGTPVAVLRRKVCAAIKRLSVRRKERRQRPAALPAHCLHSRLIPAVNVRTLVPIHLHRNKMLVHNRRNLRIVIRLPIHHMAPVAPYRANIEEHGLVLALRRRKRLGSPLVPLDGLMHGRPQVGRRGVGKGVEGGGHDSSVNRGEEHRRGAT